MLEPLKSKEYVVGVVILSIALVLAQGVIGSAQPYYYQPAPDYYHNDTASGTIMGGALGAVTGAIVGGRKDRGEGALIGAGVGAIAGNLLGRSKDRADERRAAAGAAAVSQLNQQVASAAITNYDLVEMTRAGVSDEVIISTMRARGTRLDLSPNALITLKQNGVSDRVVLAAQNMSTAPAAYPVAPGPIIVREARPTTVIVAPDPWYHGHWHYPYYHCRPRTHVHYSVGF